MAGAVLVTLIRPLSWVLGLAGFLAGGGLVLVAWPILVLPTPTGLQNALGTPVSSLVFGSPTPALVALVAGGGAAAMMMAATAMLAGAWAEREGIGVALEAAAEEGLAPAVDLAGAPGVLRIAVVRLLDLVPVAIALGLAWGPVYDAAYRELVLPDDLVTPLPLRVMADVPHLVVLVAVAWLVSDSAAAVGVRCLVLERRSVLGAWVDGWGELVRRPLRVIGTAILGLGVLVLLTGPALAAAAVGWARVRDILGDDRDPIVTLAAVVIWVSIWLGGLVLAGVGAGIRAAAWSLAVPRRLPSAGAPGASPGSSRDSSPASSSGASPA